jgi:hypothetical protein
MIPISENGPKDLRFFIKQRGSNTKDVTDKRAWVRVMTLPVKVMANWGIVSDKIIL